MRLLASENVVPFYESLSFTLDRNWEVTGMFRRLDAGPLQRGRGEAAVGELKEAAHRFEESENARAPGSIFSIKSHALCVVVRSHDGSGLDAAVWVVPDDKYERHSVPWISLSPVVARSPSLAREVISDAVAIWEEQNPSPSGVKVRCQVLKRGGHGHAEEVFSSLGFTYSYSSPLMRRALGEKPCPPVPGPPASYYGVNRA